MRGLRLLDPQWRANYSAQRLKEFVQRCRKRRLSVTPQRLAIIRALVTAENHPSAEEIYAAVRRTHPHVSLATVHRILEQFCQVGEARKVTALHGSARYDGHVEPHHHVFCVRCRRVQDVEMPEINGLIKAKARLGEFVLLAASLEIEGICGRCQVKERAIAAPSSQPARVQQAHPGPSRGRAEKMPSACLHARQGAKSSQRDPAGLLDRQ
jgi:Fur family peroxide stress response transcriptional regulator